MKAERRFVYSFLFASEQLPADRAILALFCCHFLDRFDKVICDLLGDNTIVIVAGVLAYKLTDPSSSGPQGSIGAFADQVKICCQKASCLDIHVHTVEIRLNKGNETWEPSV